MCKFNVINQKRRGYSLWSTEAQIIYTSRITSLVNQFSNHLVPDHIRSAYLTDMIHASLNSTFQSRDEQNFITSNERGHKKN